VATPPSREAKLTLGGFFWLLLMVGCGAVMVMDYLGYLEPDDPGSFFSSPEDLGSVLLPPGTPPSEAQNYLWSVEGLDPSQH
jgi:hypothetical protein